jgi:hypothetical protein
MANHTTVLTALIAAAMLTLTACGKSAEEPGHSHDGGAEHEHAGEEDHDHPHDAPVPATEAIYGDEANGAAGDSNIQNPTGATEEMHDHDHADDHDHSH